MFSCHIYRDSFRILVAPASQVWDFVSAFVSYRFLLLIKCVDGFAPSSLRIAVSLGFGVFSYETTHIQCVSGFAPLPFCIPHERSNAV